MRPACKIHGGKGRLADFIVSHFPPNYQAYPYVEGFFGMGSALINKLRSRTETAIDRDPGAISIHRTIQQNPFALIEKLRKVQYNEKYFGAFHALNEEWYASLADSLPLLPNGTYEPLALDRAIKFSLTNYIVRRMSRGGLCNDFGWSDRQRGGRPGDVNAWLTAIDNIASLNKRYLNVNFINGNALTWMEFYLWRLRRHFIYLDPPYLHATRKTKNDYRFEFTEADHLRMLQIVTDINHRQHLFLISGYDHPMYEQMLVSRGWHKYTKLVANNSSQKKKKPIKIECLWSNYEVQAS
jgi:DNA adenine methylase